MKKFIFFLFSIVLVALITTIPVSGKLRTSTVEYKQGNTTLEGYLAYDDKVRGKRPGVLVVHAWKGLGEQEKRRARELAQLGYVAFAADIYGKGIRPKTNQEAAAQATIYRSNRTLMRQRVQAGLEFLKQHRLTIAEKTAAIGYCFGGGAVLELARSGADVDGVVSFHGNLDTPDPKDANSIQGRVLVLHGADDPLVPPEQVQAFAKEMSDAKVDWELIMYGGAVHSFTNPNAGNDPSKGVAYNAKADRRSWEAMKGFFAEIFQK